MARLPRYDTGRPHLRNLWVDPAHGDDRNTGASRSKAFKTLRAAWNRIPIATEASQSGWRIMLAPGRYPADPDHAAAYEMRYGTRECPIVIQSADGPGKAILPAIRFSRCRHLHLLDVNVLADQPKERHSVLALSHCDYVLLRGVTSVARGPFREMERRENLKAGLCKHVYVEDSEFDGAWDNAIDYVAVQFGHIVGCRVHHALHEVMYVKGGCAYLLIEANEVFDGSNHGIMAGQSTGFEFLQPPWIHYEAYDIRIVNNFIHDAGGGLATAGGYNILMAHNTCYRVGSNRDLVVVGLGDHSITKGREAACKPNYLAGGWADPTGKQMFNIPNKNVFIYNNVFFNPDGYRSRIAHFGISGPVRPARNSRIPSPARADDNLQICGNVIWNGSRDMPLIDPVEKCWHLYTRSTYSQSLLRRHNAINTRCFELADPGRGDGRLVAVRGAKFRSCVIPDFTWTDAPVRPRVPPGEYSNAIIRDITGQQRRKGGIPGAWDREG